MDDVPELFRPVRGRLIVSCQAWPDDPFSGSNNMALFARAAVSGGAAAIRANGPDDIRAIRAAVGVPVIGIQKRMMPDRKILITPTVEDAAQLIAAGADAVALDCTSRGQQYGALDRLRRIKAEMGALVAADIATVEEAVDAVEAGADFILSTMRGYTAETAHVRSFEPEFISELIRTVSRPVIAEGRIWTREDARAALSAGAFAIVVGSAITRPREITAHFVSVIEPWNHPDERYVLAVDVGGTNIKYGVVSAVGDLIAKGVTPTRASGSRTELLDQLVETGRGLIATARDANVSYAALGVAAAGWIDAESGRVVYGTANLPGWSGAPIAETLSGELAMPVFVENDANALAVAEKRFGWARNARNFVCITLGTGVGAGCYIRGELHRGSHSMANALGHVTVERDGVPCTCGRRGCLEQYANTSALLRYGGRERYRSARELIAAAQEGDENARAAIRTLAGYLARGCSVAIDLLDPEMIVVSGGLAQDNPLLLDELEGAITRLVPLWNERKISIRTSMLGYFGGVVGAAAVALDRFTG